MYQKVYTGNDQSQAAKQRLPNSDQQFTGEACAFFPRPYFACISIGPPQVLHFWPHGVFRASGTFKIPRGFGEPLSFAPTPPPFSTPSRRPTGQFSKSVHYGLGVVDDNYILLQLTAKLRAYSRCRAHRRLSLTGFTSRQTRRALRTLAYPPR